MNVMYGIEDGPPRSTCGLKGQNKIRLVRFRESLDCNGTKDRAGYTLAIRAAGLTEWLRRLIFNLSVN